MTDDHEPWPGTYALQQRAQHARDTLFWKIALFVVLVHANVILWLS